MPIFSALASTLRSAKPCVISELLDTTFVGSFMPSAVMVALLVTVSAVVTVPSGYLTVTVEVRGFWYVHLSYDHVTEWVAAS